MEFVNLNIEQFSEDIDFDDLLNMPVEYNYDQSIQNNTQQGGWFFGKSNKNHNDKMALLAAAQKNFEVVCFMVNHDMVYNYSTQDDNGCTLLHYMICNRDLHKDMDKLIKKILNYKKVNEYINIQDKLGDTPIIVAVKTGNTDLVKTLLEAGADPKIKNNEGAHIGSEECSAMSSDSTSIIFYKGHDNKYDNNFKNLFKKMFTLPSVGQMSELSASFPIRLSTGNDIFTEQQQKKNSVIELPENLSVDSDQSEDEFYSTEEFALKVKNILNNYKKQSVNATANKSVETNDFVDIMTNKNMEQKGGAKNKKNNIIEGRRKIQTYNAGSAKSDRENDLNRVINRQKDDIHARVIKKIMELMNVDQETASYYKAALWKKVKEEKPELVTNVEKSLEMEKVATLKNLKNIDIKKVKQEIITYRKKRAEEQASEKSENREKDEKSEKEEKMSRLMMNDVSEPSVNLSSISDGLGSFVPDNSISKTSDDYYNSEEGLQPTSYEKNNYDDEQRYNKYPSNSSVGIFSTSSGNDYNYENMSNNSQENQTYNLDSIVLSDTSALE